MNTIIWSAISLATAILGYFYSRNKHAKKIQEFIQEWAPIIYDQVNNIVQQNPNMSVDKKSLFRQKLGEVLKSQGIELTEEMCVQAQAIADSLHYWQKIDQAHDPEYTGIHAHDPVD